jgi:hypothetical protein
MLGTDHLEVAALLEAAEYNRSLAVLLRGAVERMIFAYKDYLG